MEECLLEELYTVRKRYLSLLYTEAEPDTAEAERIACSLRPSDDGESLFFPDVDYANLNRSEWGAAVHYTRLRRALILGGREKLDSDGNFAEAMRKGLKYWLMRDYKNPNWWHNDIGMPQAIGDLGLMLWDKLDAEEKERVIALTARGSIKTRADIGRWTGANLVWGIFNSIRHALLSEDTELLHACSARAAKELSYSEEGICEDGAFRQHGPRWYSGGYGASFTLEISKIAYFFFGTSYALPEENLDILLQHVLDGQRNMMLHGYFDYSGVGRELSRVDLLKQKAVRRGVRTLASIEGIPRRDELLAFVSELRHDGTEEPDDPYSSCRWFPSVSLLTGRKGGTYIGVKCHTVGQYDAEICNGEGELCYNMSYGTRYCLMRRGDEYYNLDPIWDFAHIPGTTARTEDDAMLLAHRDWWCLPLPNNLTRGTVRGEYGIVSEKPEHDGVSLFASFFLAGDCLVCLGAGLKDEKEDGLPLTTTVDQCLPVSPAFSGDGMTVSNGGFTYRNLDPGTEMISSVVHRSGSWKRNNFELPEEKLEGDLFLSYIPVRKGKDSYAYSVSPRGKDFAVRVLSNTPDLQAILLPDGTVMAVFRKAAALTVGDKTVAGSENECVIL